MTKRQTRLGDTITTRYETTEAGAVIEHVTLECKTALKLVSEDGKIHDLHERARRVNVPGH